MTNPATTYQPLGNFIQIVDRRNRDLQVTKLLGLSIDKCFIPSIANTIGTDMSTYKIIQPRQFAYGPVTSRNGDKITIALYTGDGPAIISQAYVVFEISGTYDTVETQNFASLQQKREQLLPEYLMMWFRRPEFDRYARYLSHGSAREIFDWDEMCATQIPVPPIAEQRAIVAEYAAVQHRMEVNKRLIAKLEETAQTLYKKMFVEGVDKENLPDGWRKYCFSEFFPIKTGKKDVNWATSTGKYKFFTCSQGKYKSESFSFEGPAIIISGNGDFSVKYCDEKFEAYQRTYVLIPKNKLYVGLLYWVAKNNITQIASEARGSVISFLTKDLIENISFYAPDKIDISLLNYFTMIIDYSKNTEKEIEKLTELQSLLLARMGR